MTRIYLIRHCEAEGNIKRIFQGHTDSDISENGAMQLERLAERCRDYKFDAVYSSPLIRAFKTAQAADRHHGLPIIKDDGLMEIYGGHWEGVRFDMLPVIYPEEFKNWEQAPWKFRTADGEPMTHVYDRIWNTITGIVKQNAGKTVCVVSHGCAIRNFLCRAMGLPIEKLGSVEWCDNTAVSVIDFDESLGTNIVLANDSSHLDDSLSTIKKQDWWKKSSAREKHN